MFLTYVDRAIKKITWLYRNALFREQLPKGNIPQKERPIMGEVFLINRNVVIGRNVHIYPGVWFWGDGLIVIHDNVSIGANSFLYASKNGGVEIGAYTQIAAQSYIIDLNHGIEQGSPIHSQENTVERIKIGEDVWIGANVTILKGVSIDDGAVVGAKSVVNRNVHKGEVVAGVPIRHIRYR